jgi:tetratricopeptide (TPR) repeat protein
MTAAMNAFRTVLAITLVLALAGTAFSRNVRWKTLLAMWDDCAGKSPNKSRTHNNLGNCQLLLGNYFSALAEYQKAVALEPGNWEARYNLATTLDTVGLYNQAVQAYDVVCRHAPPSFAGPRARACARLQELLAGTVAGRGEGREP